MKAVASGSETKTQQEQNWVGQREWVIFKTDRWQKDKQHMHSEITLLRVFQLLYMSHRELPIYYSSSIIKKQQNASTTTR